jgi:hypothetical protein
MMDPDLEDLFDYLTYTLTLNGRRPTREEVIKLAVQDLYDDVQGLHDNITHNLSQHEGAMH